MPVYKFSHHLLAVLVHLAHTAVKWKTNFLILDVGDKLVNTDDTALMKYEKKFIQKAVSAWLYDYAEYLQPFDEIKHRQTYKEVADVANGVYDWK